MDDTTPAGCHKVSVESSTGNVDKDGEVVGQVERLKRLSPGMEAAPGFDLDEHLRLIAGDVRRRQTARSAAWGQ